MCVKWNTKKCKKLRCHAGHCIVTRQSVSLVSGFKVLAVNTGLKSMESLSYFKV